MTRLIKKALAAFLASVLLFSLTACGGTPSAADSVPAQTPTPEQSAPAEPSAPENNADGEHGKVLVAYFSAQNHTEAAAQTIAEHMNADIFEILPVQPYTENDLNWRDTDSRASREHDDPSLQQNVELEVTTPDNLADYDVVFVGYPIWWGNAAWPVDNFVRGNDFSGKTVYTFCTSASSGLGDSFENLAALANGGNWTEGVRFPGSVGDDEVTEWLDGLGL